MRRIEHDLGHIQPSLFDRITEDVTDPVTGEVTQVRIDPDDPAIDHVQFQMRPVDSDVLLIDAMMVELALNPLEPAAPNYRYDWDVGDVGTLGVFVAWEVIHYTGGDGTQPTPPFLVEFVDPTVIGPIQTWPVASWVTGEQVAECCDAAAEADYDGAALTATHLLWEWSGRRYPGAATRTVRPSLRCACYAAVSSPPGAGAGVRVGSCGPAREIRLYGVPVRSVDEVRIDGAVVDANTYRVDQGRYLVRTDGESWPACQDLSLPPGPGVFEIDYTWGADPPPAGILAAVELGCAIAKLCSADDEACSIPASAVSVQRQGVGYTLARPEDKVGVTATGLSMVDVFLQTSNPRKKRRRSMFVDPGAAIHRRV